MSETPEHLTEENAARTDGKRPRRHGILLAGILLLGAALTVHLFRNGVLWFNMPSKRTYPVRGVDASHYQGQMDWQTIASQGITFAFLKATEGSGTVDDCFAENWENARAAGLFVGAYHFFSFDSPAETQADNYCAVVPESEGALPPVIDLEFYRSDNLPEPDEVRRNLRILLERLRSTYGKKPIIYTTRTCWSQYLEGTDLDYTLWIRSIFTEPSDSFVPEWTFWQYNPRGMLDGYTGGEVLIDLNIFRGSEADFRKYAEARTE